MTRPLVSVCVPVGEDSRFLARALASVLSQDVDGIEVLVHEQGTGNARSVVADFADRRVRYRWCSRGGGVVANRNACLRRARGRHVAWLDSDDAWLPGSLADRVSALEADPEVAFVHGAAEIVDQDGSALPSWRRPLQHDTTEPADRAFSELVLANEITTSTVVVRRSALWAAGPFVDSGRSSSDWDMWLRLTLRGDVAYRSAPVALYRQHGASISASVSAAERLACDRRVVRRVLDVDGALISDRRRLTTRAMCALAARSLLIAQDRRSLQDAGGTLRHTTLAGRLAPRALARSLPGLLSSAVSGDDYDWHVRSRRALARLADVLHDSRYGSWLRATSMDDAVWDETQTRIAAAVRAATPATAVVATAAKWDPTILHRSGRRGRHFPDRRLLPEGYPADGRRAAAHVDDLCRAGVTHLVFPRAWGWWLDRYAELSDRLGAPIHADGDCLIFDVVST